MLASSGACQTRRAGWCGRRSLYPVYYFALSLALHPQRTASVPRARRSRAPVRAPARHASRRAKRPPRPTASAEATAVRRSLAEGGRPRATCPTGTLWVLPPLGMSSRSSRRPLCGRRGNLFVNASALGPLARATATRKIAASHASCAPATLSPCLSQSAGVRPRPWSTVIRMAVLSRFYGSACGHAHSSLNQASVRSSICSTRS